MKAFARIIIFIMVFTFLFGCERNWAIADAGLGIQGTPNIKISEVPQMDENIFTSEPEKTFCESNPNYGNWCIDGVVYPTPPTYCGDGYSSSHQALDIASDSSAFRTNEIDILASWPGKIVRSGMDDTTINDPSVGLGNLVVVEYRYEDIPRNQIPDFLRPSESLYVRYSHLSSGKPVGTEIPAGGAIGKVGETGEATGPHVHLQVKSGPSNSYSSYDKIPTFHNPLEIFPNICSR